MSEHEDDGDGLSWLSEDERAALGEDLDDHLDGEDAELEEAGPGAGQEGAAGQSQTPQKAEAGNQGGPTEALQPFQPVYYAQLPPDFQERLTALGQASQALAKQYEDGDFDLAEFQNRQRQLSEQEWALRAAALKADLAREQQQQSMAQRWAWEQESYFRRPENRAFRDDPVIAYAFEGALKLLAADEANEQRDMPWFLEEAGRLTRSKLRDLAPGADPGAGASGAGAGAASGPGTGRRGAARGKAGLPPSLAGVPAAALPDPVGDEFAYIDKLSGMEVERALARLSPDQLDRYLAQ